MPAPPEPRLLPSTPVHPGRRIAALFVVALLLKVVLIVLFEHRLYGDVIIAVNVGKAYLADHSHYHITSKTFVGPVAWYLVYHHGGVLGLKLCNLVIFSLLFWLQRRIGRHTVSDDAALVALALFAFYPGTNLTVVAGEQDDGVTLLLFALGVLLHLRRHSAFAAGLLMGLAFVFKFTALIFFAGFALYLLIVDGPRRCAAATLGMLLPFAFLNVADGFESMRNLVFAAGHEIGLSTWQTVAFKLISTGLLLSVVLAWWQYLENRDRTTLLFCLLPSVYLAYVLLSRNAFSAGYVMMQGIFFAAFPIAELLVRRRRWIVRAALGSYVVVGLAITWHNLSHDPVDLRDPAAELVLHE